MFHSVVTVLFGHCVVWSLCCVVLCGHCVVSSCVVRDSLCICQVRNEAVNKAEDSGSETGSESMLLPEEEGVKAVIDETFNYEEASDPSSDLCQPTQVWGDLYVYSPSSSFLP